MKARYIWLMVGLAFAVTLAVVIGQRLSAEAMAVTVGVIAGVAASIPTSLIVVWFATRALLAGRSAAEPAPAPAEPRVVVMTPAQAGFSQGQYPVMPGYGAAQQFAPVAYAQMPAPMQAGPRHFNVIGGADFVAVEPEPVGEVVWPR
jgi:hypothetical protein